MWVFPLVAALVATAFATLLAGRYIRLRRPYELAWAVALAMYAAASIAVVLGLAGGWTAGEFRLYWTLGAVLNVPWLAGGELMLVLRHPTVRAAVWIGLVFVTAYTIAVLRGSAIDAVALADDLPSGKLVFGEIGRAHV